MFPKKIFFGFSTILFILTVPFMLVRVYFDKDAYIPPSIIFEHINSYEGWDSFSLALKSLIQSNNVFGDAIEYFNEFIDNTIWENLLGFGELLISIFKPFFIIFEVCWLAVSFIVETIVWVFELFSIVSDYTVLSYYLTL